METCFLHLLPTGTAPVQNVHVQEVEWQIKTAGHAGQTGISAWKEKPTLVAWKTQMVKSLQKKKGARQMGPKCTSPYCSKSKARRCNDISEDNRKSMFDSFWTKLDWNQRKTYIASLVDYKPIERGKKCGHSHRQLGYISVSLTHQRWKGSGV